MQDGPLAIRQASYASVFPAGLTVAAAWDRKLAYTRGVQIGEEYRGKGSHVVLGPVAGPLGRSGYAGRNWEVRIVVETAPQQLLTLLSRAFRQTHISPVCSWRRRSLATKMLEYRHVPNVSGQLLEVASLANMFHADFIGNGK